MDVASTIPFEGLSYLFTGKVKSGVSYSVLSMLRLWRLRKIKQFFTRLDRISQILGKQMYNFFSFLEG